MITAWNNIKEKLSDVWDDIVWYTTCWTKERYKDVRHWFRVCARFKSHWKLVNYVLFHCYPWDFYYFMELQKLWIDKSNEYFKHFDYCDEDKKAEILKYQRICSRLIDIITENYNDLKWWDFDEETHKITPKIHINMRNSYRFPYRGIDPQTGNDVWNCTEMYKNDNGACKVEYYKIKAKYLYFKIIKDYADNWWD